MLISDSPSAVQYSKVELNRLIAAGAHFTISTVRTPAEVRSIMSGVDLKLPLIVMDGAALYDMKEKRYLEAEFLPRNISTQAEKIVTIGSIKGEYDVYIGDGGGNASVKKLKKLYREGR